MGYIFSDCIKTRMMVDGAYKKLKSRLYYDKTLIFAKRDLAIFESDRKEFEAKLNAISSNLSAQNKDYFFDLIHQISFRILPKKFSSKLAQTDIINSAVDRNENISKVNFFIDMPTELYIIDFLWTLLIGKIAYDSPQTFKRAAATSFKKSLFNESDDLFEGVDFESNRSFEPYFGLYTSWRDGAFTTIKRIHSRANSLLICLDLKSFYYSVEFDFDQINEYLHNDERLKSFSFLTGVIEAIYFEYTRKIVKNKKGIKNQSKTCIFPIGVTSVFILRELYLKKFDDNIVSTLRPVYYNRYVDDILLVLTTEELNGLNKDSVIQKYLISTKLVTSSNENDLKFTGYNNIRIQKDKVNCFSFPMNEQTTLLDLYQETIKLNSSEANLLPDIDIINASFMRSAYKIDNLELSNKIRDLGFLHSNNFNASRYINALLRLIKNAKSSKGIFDDFFNEINDYYQGSQSVEYSNNWRAIFELYLICGEKEKANKFFNRIIGEIDKLDFSTLNNDELLETPKKRLLKKLKNDLKEKLQITVAMVVALDYSFARKAKVKNIAVHFRNSNMFNHTLVSYPLINYYRQDNKSLISRSIESLFDYENDYATPDPFLIKWSPRYIHAIEFYIADFIFTQKADIKKYDTDDVPDRYIKYNHLGEYAFEKTSIEQSEINGITLYTTHIRSKNVSDPKIAIVNTDISTADALNAVIAPHLNLSIDNKTRLFKNLNTAKEGKADILVFPEFYCPIEWLIDIAMFAIRSGITLITGLQYMTIGKRAYNNVCSIVPIISGRNFKQGFLQVREKNYYAPEEKIKLSRQGYNCNDAKHPCYFLINNNRYAYSTILCYEFTDIASRACMKSKVEMLFVPQLNKDTNYFSAIVESTARDLHCFIIQANTSMYGDSRITAPYKTENKNILLVKGGETDVVLVATAKVDELLLERQRYLDDMDMEIKKCFNCANSGHKKKGKCEKCDTEKHKTIIKGTPPNFTLR